MIMLFDQMIIDYAVFLVHYVHMNRKPVKANQSLAAGW